MSPISPTKILYTFGIFTTSFDIALVFNVGPNIRLSQLALLVLMLNLLILEFRRKIIIPVAFCSLMAWFFFIVLFIPNSGFIPKGVGYAAWLLINIGTVLAFVQLAIYSLSIEYMIRMYVYSFTFVASFGLLQFFGGIFGFGHELLIETWWIPDIFPRINGFSYEPSFFVTYLIPGWVLTSYLLKNNVKIIPTSLLKKSFVIITLAIILSGSRLGLIFMAIWYSQCIAIAFWRIASCKFYFKDLMIIALFIIILFAAYIIYFFISDSDLFKILMFGVGLGNTSSHSIDERLSGFSNIIQIFLDSPIIGYSLGGLSHALGELGGFNITDFEASKLEGNGVFLEVLAASGIIGFIPFVSYIFTLLYSSFKIADIQSDPNKASLLRGLAFSCIFGLAIIQPNQNILRPYVWVNIGLLSASIAVFSRKSYEKFIYQK